MQGRSDHDGPSAASNDGKPVPVESLLDEDDFAVITEENLGSPRKSKGDGHDAASTPELEVLRAAGCPLTASQIAARLGYGIGRGTSVGNQLAGLRKSGLVVKSGDVPAVWSVKS